MASLKALQDAAAKDDLGFTFEVMDRDGTPLRAKDGSPTTFTIYGSESKTFLDRRSAMYREVAKAGDEIDNHTLEAFEWACALKGWSGWDDGERELPYSESSARAFMALEFLRRQVRAHALRGASFFGDASPASAGS